MLDFLNGYKTKIGGLGAALLVVIQQLVAIAGSPEGFTTAATLALLKTAFLSLGGYGLLAALRNAIKAKTGI